MSNDRAVLTVKTLRAAAQLLRGKDLSQGTYARDNANYPVLSTDPRAAFFSVRGALRAVQPRGSLRDEWALSALSHYLGRCLGDGRIDAWNDEPGRTKEEVIAALEGAADELEGKKG